jgi:hypothetical protein
LEIFEACANKNLCSQLLIYAQASNNYDEAALVFSFRLYHASSFDIGSSETKIKDTDIGDNLNGVANVWS